MIDLSNLRRLRQEKSLTLRELSELSGVSAATISRMERGIGNPTYKEVQKLSGALDWETPEKVINLDVELVGRVKGLKLEFREVPQPELLIRIPNRNPDVDYEVEVVSGEFTSLCPLNLSQPDYATLYIKYRPDLWCVELKSLKFFLVGFRQVPIFHEEVPATILRALVELLGPREMEVVGYFTTRGGIETTVRATYKEVL